MKLVIVLKSGRVHELHSPEGYASFEAKKLAVITPRPFPNDPDEEIITVPAIAAIGLLPDDATVELKQEEPEFAGETWVEEIDVPTRDGYQPAKVLRHGPKPVKARK